MVTELMNSSVTNLPLLPIFTFLFCAIYLFAYHLVFRSWSPKHRPEASSCFISLVHGTPATILAFCSILPQAYDYQGLSSPNSAFQNLILDFSSAYFFVDILHYLAFFPNDYLFIAHHVATLFVFLTCRYVTLHGAMSILVLLFLAEITSACQNLWTMASMRKSEDPLAARVYNLLSPPFYAFYTIARGVAGPVFFYKMSSFYLSGGATEVISWWITLSWVVVVGGAIAVSILWVVNNWIVLYKERCIAQESKEKKI